MARINLTRQLPFLVVILISLCGSIRSEDQALDTLAMSALRFRLRNLPPAKGCELFCKGVSDMTLGKTDGHLDYDSLAKLAQDLTDSKSALGSHLSSCIDMVRGNNGSDGSAAERSDGAKQEDSAVGTKEVEELRSRNFALKGKKDDLSMKNSALRAKVGDATAKNNDLRRKIAELGSASVTFRDQFKKLTDELAALTIEEDVSTEKRASVQCEKSRLTDESAALTSKIDELARQEQTLASKLKELTESAASSKYKTDRLKQEAANLTNDIKKLESQIKDDATSHEKEMSQLKAYIKRARDANETFRLDDWWMNHGFDQYINSLRSKVSGLNSAISQYKNGCSG